MRSDRDVRRDLLGIELALRTQQGEWDNRYVRSHLEEARLYVKQAMIQLDYAELAMTDPNRGGKRRCFTCTEPWQDCHCAE